MTCSVVRGPSHLPRQSSTNTMLIKGMSRKRPPTTYVALIAFLVYAGWLNLMTGNMSGIWSKCTNDEMLPIVTDRSRVKVDFLSLGSSFGTNESDPTVFGDAYSGSWWTSVSNFLRYKKVENKKVLHSISLGPTGTKLE
eukprot:scaffold4565_cov53-Cyclotella_meneghiniana.AAC.1